MQDIAQHLLLARSTNIYLIVLAVLYFLDCFGLVDKFNPFVLCPPMIELMVVLLDIFLDGEYGCASIGSRGYSKGWVWNLKTTICCFTSGK